MRYFSSRTDSPLLRIMWGNAFLLSLIYLLLGLGVEIALRLHPTSFLRRMSLSLDSLPARALELSGAMEPLRAAYFSGRIAEWGVRVVFGITTMVIIFLLAMVVGTLMGGVRTLLARRALRSRS
ncbi:hypothetical protein ACLEPN_32215 [Myxococcus sp. 1LA]